MVQEIEIVFSSSKDSLNHSLSHDILLLESVKEQLNADNLSPKPEFVDKVGFLYSCGSKMLTLWSFPQDVYCLDLG